MAKPLRVAGEVDSYCTKCKMVLNHRIISMKEGKAYQVECLTCHGYHLFRSHAPGDKPTAQSGAARGGVSRAPRASAGAAKAEAARMTREQTWEKAIAGRKLSDFQPFSVAERFNEGDLIKHKKFGDGVVLRVIDMSKIEVLFRDGETKTLAHGMVG